MKELLNYKLYLRFINEELEKFFNQQKPFIFCKKGCAKCCKNAEFPFSKLEVTYLLAGFVMLPAETQAVIEQKIKDLYEEKKVYKGEKPFFYDCPFLINDECSVYEYRGVICRAFGLMTQIDGTEKVKAPFCNELGLNYSNVIDQKTQKISSKMYKELNCKEEPIAYNVSYKFLTNEDFEKDFEITFGEKKPLLNWFIDEALAQSKDSVCKQTDL